MLARRAAGTHDAASLELCAKLLELNPEVLAGSAKRSREQPRSAARRSAQR